MSRMIKIGLSFFALAMVFLVSACVPSVNLKMVELSRENPIRGSVVVGTVSNKRADGAGGDNFDVLGKVRGGYGNPFTVKTEHDRDLNIVLKEAAKAALEHTGYSTSQGAGRSLRLDIDLLNFWCDGYTGYKIEADVVVKLVEPVKGKVLAKKSIKSQSGFAIVASYSQMHDAFDNVINDIQSQIVAFVKTKEFRNAAK